MTQASLTPDLTFPKPGSGALLDELSQYVIAEPYPFVVDLEASRGLELATVDGDRITDWCGLYGSRLIGYNHPRLYEPDYVRRLVVAANTKMANPDFLTRECLDYYRLLHALRPKCMRGERVEVYAVNSGAEAVENMMKYLINLHHKKMQAQGKSVLNHRFIYFEQAFHGRTVYALNITKLSNDPIATRDYQGLIQGNLQVPFPEYDSRRREADNQREVDKCLATLDYLMSTYRDEIAGVILEPLQGAGGHRLALPRFYQELSRLCHHHGIAWGLDEVQTSGGQTGEVFSIDLFDVPHPPQAVATAKKFGNGVVYMLNSMEDIGVLDSTWGGTLSDMVRFCEEWQIVEDEGLLQSVESKGARLFGGLNTLVEKYPDTIGNVRGLGLYQGFSLLYAPNKGRLIDMALEQEKLLLLGAGTDSIRFRPPLDVTEAEIDELIRKLGRLLGQL
ncbi:aminotransferase class III-fold pyridoxal phosphate-dependent enzyme [Asticcacaulis excentricus]|uniref:Aminotransferase class-III n=1 Tax=Asticcacaulis excentricus (strain ATCC 15261 / DSM 4724 / KCTC 12464 / NCIMB 9791 / VKM B-1370 / CB 48) TaxID=573065 RepID=E8RS68_ASTEC|nr:aminotransferase class III-fold pyridoxal phosphate-dependent enzyme [Asticcacaulis excentricus]ADU14339.1 aminotransferase class-III [Asticcacaulis excentricus CB 48]